MPPSFIDTLPRRCHHTGDDGCACVGKTVGGSRRPSCQHAGGPLCWCLEPTRRRLADPLIVAVASDLQTHDAYQLVDRALERGERFASSRAEVIADVHDSVLRRLPHVGVDKALRGDLTMLHEQTCTDADCAAPHGVAFAYPTELKRSTG